MFTWRAIRYRVEFWLLGFLFCGLIGGCAPTLRELVGPLEPGQEIMTLKTRPGVTMRILVAKPKGIPKGTFVYFPGGEGQLVGSSAHILRSITRHVRPFAGQGFTVVVVDWPSDRWELTDEFKISEAYTEDIQGVIEFVSQKWAKPIFLMGHSRGTISVAHIGALRRDDRIKGIVLTGSVTGTVRGRPRAVSLATLPLENVTYPTLFVHHRDDACVDIHGAREQRNRLIKSPRVGFIEVVGGDPPGSDPCRGGNNPHTFLGREKEVIKAITDWASGKPVAERIGQ